MIARARLGRDRSPLLHSPSTEETQRLVVGIILRLVKGHLLSHREQSILAETLSGAVGQNTYLRALCCLTAWWLHSKGKHPERETEGQKNRQK